MTDGLGGLIGALRGGRSNWPLFDRARIRAAFSMSDGSGVTPEVAGAAEDEAEHSQEEVGASSSNPPPPDRLERWLARRSSFHTPKSTLAGKSASGLPPISIPDSEDEGHMRVGDLISSKAVVEEPSRSKRKPKGRRFALKGDGSSSVGQDDLVLIARRTRSAGCRSPSLASPAEQEAYAKLVVASSKVMEAFNKFTVTMEDRIRAFCNESEVEKGKAEVRRLTEELRVAKEETRKKTGEAMLLKDEWKRARREKADFETEVAALRTKIAELEAGRD
ncbi:hypothetical protein F2Q70_00043503 [Brassica cretica]|uniref:Uncharacterized protein n=1 Tax=Brassica cretica TaxID=69181 RepID=A0A8S9KEY0_BRACR|nr:hypothetical protein F2Q70_00043503 [Brassica cretica]